MIRIRHIYIYIYTGKSYLSLETLKRICLLSFTRLRRHTHTYIPKINWISVLAFLAQSLPHYHIISWLPYVIQPGRPFCIIFFNFPLQLLRQLMATSLNPTAPYVQSIRIRIPLGVFKTFK